MQNFIYRNRFFNLEKDIDKGNLIHFLVEIERIKVKENLIQMNGEIVDIFSKEGFEKLKSTFEADSFMENVNIDEVVKYWKKRRIKFDDLDLIESRCNDSIWSLIADSFGEVNSYKLTFFEAINMIVPAVDEDGFKKSELLIYAPYKRCK